VSDLYDIFLSHAWADGDRPRQIADALTKAGLRVWFDANEIADFASITKAVTEGLANSKALVAYYSKAYPLRRACQWELTAAFLAAQQEGDPRRRVLVINPEENADHIYPVELRDAKFRGTPRDNGVALDDLVQSVLKHVKNLSRRLAHVQPMNPPQWFGNIPIGSTRFVGRLAEMWQMHSLLHAGDVTQITGAPVGTGIGQVSGLGGVGKSLLAEEYAIQFGASYPGGIFWLRAYGNDDAKGALDTEGREAERQSQIRTIAGEMGIVTHGLDASEIRGAVRREVAYRGKWCLWIVDDVPNGLDGETLRHWFGPHPLVKTLLTTRSREYGSLARSIDLTVLSQDEAYQLLTSRLQPADEDEAEQSRLLGADLGYHALAVDVTASALRHSVSKTPFADFRSRLEQPDKDALELAEALSDALPNGHEKSIAHTMLRSIRTLGTEGLDFLRLASVLAVAPIPLSLITAVFQYSDAAEREHAEERASLASKQVTDASLAEIAGEHQESRSVHTLVSRTVRFHEKKFRDRILSLRQAAIESLNAEIAIAAADPRLHKAIELHVAHARHLVQNVKEISAVDLLAWVARYDSEQGLYSSARALYAQEVEFRSRIQGQYNLQTLTAQSNLALKLQQVGDFAGAQRLQEEVLAHCIRLFGEKHPATFTPRLNLAQVLQSRGEWQRARELLEPVLTQGNLDEAEIHLDVLALKLALSEVLRAQGDLTKARTYQEEVLQMRRALLGPEHPNTLTAEHKLCETLSASKSYQEARQLYAHTLSVRRRILGQQHPDTLASMNGLALMLRTLGDPEGACRLQEETLEIRRRVLGSEHPGTTNSAWNLFRTLQLLGYHKAARAILENDLLWLLNCDPDTLTVNQRKVRGFVQKEMMKPPKKDDEQRSARR
jgi:tetratricopeptide (TPR) repeat protein